MSLIITDPNIAALQNSVERINITIQDSSTDPATLVDPYDMKLTVSDIGGSTLFIDRWPQQPNRIVKSSTGKFYVDFGYASATLSALAPIGTTTITITDASPQESNGWPTSSYVIFDEGQSTYEKIDVSSYSITGGVGTITLASPTTFAHSVGSFIQSKPRETDAESEWLFNWQVRLAADSEVTSVLQRVSVMSTKAASFLPDLRLMIDKSHKLIAPTSSCFLGYTDSQLLYYLYAGLQNINAYQPSLTFTMANFPLEYKQVLIDSALISGAMSQQLYAIDMDIPSYSDQGTAFVITHQAALASFLNQITQRADRLIPQMKLQLIQPGTLHTQVGPNFRLNQLVQAAPSGAVFRGITWGS